MAEHYFCHFYQWLYHLEISAQDEQIRTVAAILISTYISNFPFTLLSLPHSLHGNSASMSLLLSLLLSLSLLLLSLPSSPERTTRLSLFALTKHFRRISCCSSFLITFKLGRRAPVLLPALLSSPPDRIVSQYALNTVNSGRLLRKANALGRQYTRMLRNPCKGLRNEARNTIIKGIPGEFF